MQPMQCDLLIVNYNTKDLLQRLLDTLHSDYEPGIWNLYIADNGSQDGSWEWLRDKYYNITYAVQNENVGYAAAINQLAAQSSSDILCAVNADTWFNTNHVKQVIERFNQHADIAVLGPKQLDERFRIRHAGIVWAPDGTMKHRGWAEYDPLDAGYHDVIPCATVSGSIYYMSRAAWDDLNNCKIYKAMYPDVDGAFLPTPMYFEETWFSVHAQHHDWKVVYDGTVPTAGHTWSGSAPHSETLKYFGIAKEIYRETCKVHKVRNEFYDHTTTPAL